MADLGKDGDTGKHIGHAKSLLAEDQTTALLPFGMLIKWDALPSPARYRYLQKSQPPDRHA
jgi:hypothetical protein